jgi:hypothetical protein
MDKVSESLLNEFSNERGITQLHNAAAGSNFNRDNIRTEPTTKNVIAHCQKVIEAEKARPN